MVMMRVTTTVKMTFGTMPNAGNPTHGSDCRFCWYRQSVHHQYKPTVIRTTGIEEIELEETGPTIIRTETWSAYVQRIHETDKVPL